MLTNQTILIKDALKVFSLSLQENGISGELQQRVLNSTLEKFLENETVEMDNILSSLPSFSISHLFYFVGVSFVIGAMTLLLHIGWNRGAGHLLCFISSAYSIAFLFVAHEFWYAPSNEQEFNLYKTPGGIFSVLSSLMFTFTVYSLTRIFNIFPNTEGGYNHKQNLLMDTTTALHAFFVYILFVPFSFLIAIITVLILKCYIDYISISQNYLKIPEDTIFRSCKYYGTILFLFLLYDDIQFSELKEKYSGEFFWAYSVAITSFWVGFTKQESNIPFINSKVLYFFLNLLLAASYIITKQNLSIILSSIGFFVYNALFSELIKKHNESPLLVIYLFLMSLVIPLASYIDSVILLSTGHLTTILIYLKLMSHEIDNKYRNSSLISIEGNSISRVLCLLEVFLWVLLPLMNEFYMKVDKYIVTDRRFLQTAVGIVITIDQNIFLDLFIQNTIHATEKEKKIFILYRTITALVLLWTVYTGIISEIIPSSPLLFIGVFGLLLQIYLQISVHHQQSSPRHFIVFSSILVLVCLSRFSMVKVWFLLFDIDVAYLSALGIYSWGLINCFPGRSGRWRLVYCFDHLFLFCVGLIFDFPLIMLISVAGIFIYCAHMAYYVFRNSILYPMVLIALGIFLINIGIKTQKYGDDIRHQFEEFVQNSDRIMYMSLIFSVCVNIVYYKIGWKSLHNWGEISLEGDPLLKVNSIKVVPPDNPSHDGLKMIIRATKPSNFTLNQAHLYINTPSFWRSVRVTYGSWPVYIFQLTMYPVNLCPVYINKDQFPLGSEDIVVNVAIRRTIKNILKNIKTPIDVVITHTGNNQFKKGILIKLQLDPQKVINEGVTYE